MNDLLQPFWHVTQIVAGYILAVVAAALVLVGGFHAAPVVTYGLLPEAGTVAAAVILSTFIGGFAFVPALVAIAIGEVARWRGPIYWVVAGGAIAFVARALGYAPRFPEPPTIEASAGAARDALLQAALGAARPVELALAALPGGGLGKGEAAILAAGFAGGLVYWLVAGRRAGAWSAARS